MLPLLYGMEALLVSAHMLLVGLAGLIIYKWLKGTTGRVRPSSYSDDIFQNVAALDRFSFPSGHTLHATSFTLVVLHYHPEWGVLLIPFSALVYISRVVLGLHYPSDVLFGALIGAGLAHASFLLMAQ